MGDHSKIEWTEATWNPVVGCSVVSPGCTNCYAMRMAGTRLDGNPKAPHYAGTTTRTKAGPVWTGKVALAPEHILTAPLRWRRPREIFVNSMGDLFHEDVPDEWIDRIFAVMALARQHAFQVLTKRSARMRAYLAQFEQRGRYVVSKTRPQIGPDPRDGNRFLLLEEGQNWPLPNVWLGVSAEDQRRADERVPDLLATPAAVRFVSAEPLLGSIRFDNLDGPSGTVLDAMTGKLLDEEGLVNRGPSLDWIIVGGESGPGARPMHPDWARSIRDQCAAAGLPFFFKQWGEWGLSESKFGSHDQFALANDGTLYQSADLAWPDGKRCGEAIRAGHDHAHLTAVYRVGKRRAGRLLDGREHNGRPEVR
jgi:protein gp37